ncbi:MAG: CBS domain-containing protein [Steroidobacter sp.]
MLCSDIMKIDIECVSPETSIRDAARKMRDQNVGFLPACDESMRVVGTITDRDITVRAVAANRPPEKPVEEILTHGIIACRPEDDLSCARELMSQHQISRIMCINRSGRIEGVISLSDIVDWDDIGGASVLREVSARERRGDSGRQSAGL